MFTFAQFLRESLVDDARNFAIQAHGQQKYGSHPYVYHLDKVVQVLKHFHITDPVILAAAYLHDTLEDTGISEVVLRGKFPSAVVNIVRAVSDVTDKATNVKDKVRTWQNIRSTPKAVIVKLADRIANVEEGGSLLDRYRREYDGGFREILYKPGEADAMWEHLASLLGRKLTEGAFTPNLVHQPWSHPPLGGKVSDEDNLRNVYDVARNKAEDVQPRLEAILKRASSGQFKILIGIKTWDSFSDKVMNRGKQADRVHDVLRSAVLTDTQQEAKDVVDNLKKREHLIEFEFKDRGTDKQFGYYGSYHLKLIVDGLICEVQVMTKRLWTYKSWGHEFYEKYRSSDTKDPQDLMRSKRIFALGNKPQFKPKPQRTPYF